MNTYKSIGAILILTLMCAAAFADEIAADPASAGADTVKQIRGKYYGLGLGMSLGSMPLFGRWIDGLPDSLGDVGLQRYFGSGGASDTVERELRYRIVEAPEEFNYFIPFNVTFYNIMEKGIVSAGVSFFYNSKSFQGTIFPHLDSVDRRINLYDNMRYVSLTFEAAYHFEIPPKYFNIDGSQHSYITLMLGASPLQYFSSDGGVTVLSDDSDERLHAAADTVRNYFSGTSGNGAAVMWRAGLSTIRPNARGGGLMIGICYGGGFSGWFYKDGHRVFNGHIHKEEDERDHTLSFMSNRIEFTLTWLMRMGNK